MWQSFKLAWADSLFRKGTQDSIRAVIRLEPDAYEYCFRLSRLDPAHGTELLETALRLNPSIAQSDIELGLRD
jgi:hypothetical protein